MLRLKILLNRILTKFKFAIKNIYYIGGNDVLPTPLSKKEEEDLVLKLVSGDEKVRSTLIERNLRLVVYIARKFENTGVNVEDLVSVGTIGLIKAVNTFNPEKKIKLATYASRCIENEILMLIRNNKKNRNEVYLQDPIGVDKEGNEISLIDILSSDDDSVIEIVENHIQIGKLYVEIDRVLKGREKAIIKMRYGLGDGKPKNQREIAQILGISWSYVSRIEKRALKKLYRQLNGNCKV